MPAKLSNRTTNLKNTLQELGQQLRDRRKELGVSSIAASEAAGLSRVTLYRIEQGEPSVAMSAYLSVIVVLGLSFNLVDVQTQAHQSNSHNRKKIPKKIQVAQYPQLKKISWQLKKTATLSPEDALNLYERNWRHVDLKSLNTKERSLIKSLLELFGRKRLIV